MRNELAIRAPADRIYALAAATERWPEILPHYRFVRVLKDDGVTREVQMGARRGVVPVSWRALQTNDAWAPRIMFRHLRGWTRGMDVCWRFEPQSDATLVSIEHELDSPFASIIATHFIDPIATRTLQTMKTLAERA